MRTTTSEAVDTRRRNMAQRMLTALETLLESGTDFADVPVEQIISQAGIARSTFYIYFDDKRQLLKTIAADVVADVIEVGGEWAAFPSTGSRAELREIFADLVVTYRRHASVMGAMSEASVSDPEIQEEFHRLLKIGHGDVSRHIRAGQLDGSVRSDVLPNETLSWLISMIDRGLYRQVREASGPHLDALIDALTGVVWQTLYAGTPGRRSEPL